MKAVVTRDMALNSPVYPLPAFIRQALGERNLMAAYRARPPYQQSDYIGWVTRTSRWGSGERMYEVIFEAGIRMRYGAGAC